MISLLYRFLIKASHLLGTWFFVWVSRCIAMGYFLLFPSRRMNSIRFYRALYPEKEPWYAVYYTLRQYLQFTTTFLDRFQMIHLQNITATTKGKKYLQAIAQDREGGILLMSHLGNWEIAAHFLHQTGVPVMLYMGRKHKEQLEKMQKDTLSRSGVTIIAADPEDSSPFNLLDSIQHLRKGGVISMTGDRIWSSAQRTVPVTFLGHEIQLPETPYLLALLTQVPLYLFFAFRTEKNHYYLTVSEPIHLPNTDRGRRAETIRLAAQQYADTLETLAREHPFEWYHFEAFV